MRRSFARAFSAPQSYLAHEIFEGVGVSSTRQKYCIAFLHGILGNSKNWRTPAREFIKLRNNFIAVSFDHRAHGLSNSLSKKPLTVKTCAEDLKDFIAADIIGVKHIDILCAHSFGGKVALEYLKLCKELNLPAPKHTWILDSLPGLYDIDADKKITDQSVLNVMNTLSSAPESFESKNKAIEYLLNNGVSSSISLWLANSMVTNEQKVFKFGFDVNAVKFLFEDFCYLDMWPFLEAYDGKQGKIHFIRAGKNTAWNSSVLQKFESLASEDIKLYTMPHVGHWLHSDDLHGLLKIINSNSV